MQVVPGGASRHADPADHLSLGHDLALPDQLAGLADAERLGEFSHLTVGIEYEPPWGILGDVADKLVFEQRHEEDAEKILAGLKALCEGVIAR